MWHNDLGKRYGIVPYYSNNNDDDDDDDNDCLIIIMIVAPCSMFVFFGSINISIALIHDNKH